MQNDLPRTAKAFRSEVFLKSIGLLLIPLGAMIIGACRSQSPPDEDMIQVVLKWVMVVGGLVWFLALPYFFMILTPKCDSCKVRTKRYRDLQYDNEEWKVTICPRCRERFMHQSL